MVCDFGEMTDFLVSFIKHRKQTEITPIRTTRLTFSCTRLIFPWYIVLYLHCFVSCAYSHLNLKRTLLPDDIVLHLIGFLDDVSLIRVGNTVVFK